MRPSEIAKSLTDETRGLVVEAQRAYLAWQGALRTLNRAKDGEAAARGAYVRLSNAAAQMVAADAEPLHPEGEEMGDVRRIVWADYLNERPTARWALDRLGEQAAERAEAATQIESEESDDGRG